ncbi:MAG: sulfatase [Bacteroidaceae bacterium]
MNYLHHLLIGSSSLALFSFSLQAQSVCRPNVIIINVDDLGWTDMSNNGSSYYETPNIDALRSAGVWFDQGYAGAANSAPSRACMLTGMNTPRHGIYTVGSSERVKAKNRKLIPIENNTVLKPGTQILTQVLHDNGYLTCHVGKWHVTEDPSTCGVDINIAGNHAGHPISYFSPYHNANLSDGPKGEYLPDRLGREAVNFIATAPSDKPFFLYYATYSVHTPLQAPKNIIDKYKTKKCDTQHNNPIYAAMIEGVDKNIGKVLQMLKERHLEENTIIFFTGDNGGVYKISRQWPLRAGKGSFYEGGIRVPFIIYQKGKFEHEEINSSCVSQMDFFPTIMNLLHIDTSNLTLDGENLLPLLSHQVDHIDRSLYYHFPAYLEGGNKETTDRTFRTRPVSVVRNGDWKLIENYETDVYELYNLKDDLSETKNLGDLYPDVRIRLIHQLEKWKKDFHAPIPTKLNPQYRGK